MAGNPERDAEERKRSEEERQTVRMDPVDRRSNPGKQGQVYRKVAHRIEESPPTGIKLFRPRELSVRVVQDVLQDDKYSGEGNRARSAEPIVIRRSEPNRDRCDRHIVRCHPQRIDEPDDQCGEGPEEKNIDQLVGVELIRFERPAVERERTWAGHGGYGVPRADAGGLADAPSACSAEIASSQAFPPRAIDQR